MPVVKKRPVGRPKKEVDINQLRYLAKIQCTLSEIAAGVGIGLSTLMETKEFLDIIDEERDNGVASIRHMQYQLALKGNADMLKWIGKQYAKQAEKQETKNDDRITIVIEAEDKDV